MDISSDERIEKLEEEVYGKGTLDDFGKFAFRVGVMMGDLGKRMKKLEEENIKLKERLDELEKRVDNLDTWIVPKTYK